MKKKYLMWVLRRLKRAAQKELNKQHADSAAVAISTCAELTYLPNLYYSDNALEDLLRQLSEQEKKSTHTGKRSDTILFYDGLGFDNRGLIQIYLKALCKLGKVIYVAHEEHRHQLPTVLKILADADGEAVFFSGKTYTQILPQLDRLFVEHAPQHAFLYTYPDDVPALAAFMRAPKETIRYQINLTDHAYWLGVHAFDRCIEFRDYGASISRDYRKISAEKLVKLPFYPSIDYYREFEGFPFPCPENRKVIFSGGNIYKTLGGNDGYYKLADFILSEFPDTIFWYAGSGNCKQMQDLIAKYPDRVWFTKERPDLYQVLRNCVFYLSTYPITGGLMFQYAASAGKIPVTLRYDSEADGYLLNQQALGIEANTMEEAKALIRKLLTDNAFRREKEQLVHGSVLNQTAFEENLKQLLSGQDTVYPISFYPIDTDDLHRAYDENLKVATVLRTVGRRSNTALLPYMPIDYLCGIFLNGIRKLRRLF